MVGRLLRGGDLVPHELMVDLVIKAMTEAKRALGFFVTGFPRDMAQVRCFEERASVLTVAEFLTQRP